jgi:hypothetical protein
MKIPDNFSENLEIVFRVTNIILKSFDADADPGPGFF